MGQGDEARVDAMIAQVIAREGDYSDHPADRGGATRFGITEAVARADGYAGPMRRLPLGRAEARGQAGLPPAPVGVSLWKPYGAHHADRARKHHHRLCPCRL